MLLGSSLDHVHFIWWNLTSIVHHMMKSDISCTSYDEIRHQLYIIWWNQTSVVHHMLKSVVHHMMKSDQLYIIWWNQTSVVHHMMKSDISCTSYDEIGHQLYIIWWNQTSIVHHMLKSDISCRPYVEIRHQLYIIGWNQTSVVHHMMKSDISWLRPGLAGETHEKFTVERPSTSLHHDFILGRCGQILPEIILLTLQFPDSFVSLLFGYLALKRNKIWVSYRDYTNYIEREYSWIKYTIKIESPVPFKILLVAVQLFNFNSSHCQWYCFEYTCM